MFKVEICFLVLIFGLLACSDKPVQISNETKESKNENINFSIKLETGGGDVMGSGFRYKLDIDSNGTVIFEGIRQTKVTGKIEDKLSQEKINQLLAEINRANFFSLKDSYTEAANCPTYATDQPTVNISIKLENKEKSVIHYLGCRENGRERKVFPQQLYNLENNIDEIVETRRWIGEKTY